MNKNTEFMFRWFLFLSVYILLQFTAYGQVEGTVFDLETKTPLSDAYILYENTFTLTDKSGNFNINLSIDTLIIKHLGYRTDTLYGLRLSKQIKVYLLSEYNQIEQVEVQSGMARHTLLKMPSSVGLLSKSELMQSSEISFVEKLNQLPGVFVHQGTLSTNRITIRGIGSRSPYSTNRIKAYFNGVPITTGDGVTEIEDVSSSVINTIEVLKGSKSALYGAGLGGVILISGKKYLKEGLHGSAILEAGSYLTLKPELNIEYKKNKFSISSSYATTHTNGWRQNSEYNRQNFNSLVGYTHKNSETEILIQLIKTKAFIPSSLSQQTYTHSPDSAAPNWLAINGFEEYQKGLLALKHTQKLGANVTNTIIVFSSFKNGYESRPFNILSDESKSLGARNIAELVKGSFSLLGGFELLFDHYNWSVYETNLGNKGELLSEYSEDRKPFNLFIQTGFNLKNSILIEAGLSYNFLTYSLADHSNSSEDLSGKYSYTPVLSPYLGVNIPVKRQWHLYGSVSHGFSAPSVEETLMPSGEINPNLKPETGWNLETGFRVNSMQGNIFIDANLYLLLVDNLLVTERLSEEVFYGKNAGSTQHNGIEISSMVRLNNHQKFKLPQVKINASYNYCHAIFTDFIDDGISYKNNFLPGIPDMTLWTALTLKYNTGLYLVTQIQYTSSQYLNDENLGQNESYMLTHIKLGYAYNSSNQINYEFSAGVKNVFDTHYASMLLVNAPSFGGSAPRYYYPGEPRSYYTSVAIRF